MLLREGEVDAASDMATSIAKFLTNFGMMRERNQMRQRVASAVAANPLSGNGTLTLAEYLREIGIARDERERGNFRAAFKRLTLLLTRLESQPQSTEVGPSSFPHSRMLQELGNCLKGTRQYAAAEARLHEALAILDTLVHSQPENRSLKGQRASVLGDLGTILELQGHYIQAQQRYEQALTEFTAVQDMRNHAAVLGRLGNLTLEQKDYERARMRHQQALEQFQALGEPAEQAVNWHQLGRVALEQGAWAEAGRCYRESLILKEQQGDIAGAATICNQLGNVAAMAGRPDEAEGWYQGALSRFDQVEPDSASYAICLYNLADLLVNEVQAGRAAKIRLVEARNYAEQARRIEEQSGVSVESWKAFNILADIADLQDHPQEAQSCRQQARESYVAFAGNRYHIQQQFASLIATIVAATRGEVQVRAQVEAALPQWEDHGWHIRSAVERIWAGERDWRALTTDLGGEEALLILLVLEALGARADT
jgi:tetratricopeptide (TPR) repeat protein